MSHIVYFSKMFQAVPHLAQVEAQLSGVFISNRRSTLRAANNLYPNMPTAKYSRLLGRLAKGNRLLHDAQVIVTGSPYRSFLGAYNAKKCTVFHGTYMVLSKDALMHNAHFDLLCVIGPRMQQMIERFSPEMKLNTVTTGFLPFCEFPEKSISQRELILLRLGLDPSLQTILYTPSRRGVGSWEFAAEQLASTTPRYFNLILRPHPSQALTSRSKDRASFKRVQVMASKRQNTLLDLTTYSLPMLQSVADLIVSDANSPAEESLFYDVPQLFIETPRFSMDVLRSMATNEGMHARDIEQLLTLYDCGARVHLDSAIDFPETLNRALADASLYSDQRSRYFSWVFGSRDRLASVRVANALKAYV